MRNSIADKYCRCCGAKKGEEHEDICPDNKPTFKPLCTEKQRLLLFHLGFRGIDACRLTKRQAGRVISMLKSGKNVARS